DRTDLVSDFDDRLPVPVRNGRGGGISDRDPLAVAMDAALGARLRTGHYTRRLTSGRSAHAHRRRVHHCSLRLARAFLHLRSARLVMGRDLVLVLSRFPE